MKELIRKKESIKYPGLFVHKYANSVFYKNLWNEDKNLLESRGRVYNSKGDVVINPFTKVFNYGENDTTIDDQEICLYVEKMNGFMACCTYVKEFDEVIVSTTGSLDSLYANMAREMMSRAIKTIEGFKNSTTYIFEVCHPSDPHIIEENIGVYLIGARDVLSEDKYYSYYDYEEYLDKIAKALKVTRPTYGLAPFGDIRLENKKCIHEGFMVYSCDTQQALKLKSPYYLSSKAIARRKDILTLNKARIDEEFYPIIDELLTKPELSEQQRLEFIRNYFKEL
jgi:hypothetical protein